jgi:small subunit ribosomal protein S6
LRVRGYFEVVWVEIVNKEYEAMVLFQPNAAEETIVEVEKKVTELVAQYDGKLYRADRWAKRFLAYPIKKYREGFYVIYRFRAPQNIVADLEYMFKYHADILRFLITDYTVKVEKAARRKAKRSKGLEK